MTQRPATLEKGDKKKKANLKKDEKKKKEPQPPEEPKEKKLTDGDVAERHFTAALCGGVAEKKLLNESTVLAAAGDRKALMPVTAASGAGVADSEKLFEFPAQYVRDIPLRDVVAADSTLSHAHKEPRRRDPYTFRVDGEGEGECRVPQTLSLDAQSALVKIGHV